MYGFTFDKDGNITGEKDTLSYSACMTWEKSHAEYRAHYYEGKRSFTSPYTIFGSSTHKLAEDGKLNIVDHEVKDYDNEVRIHAEINGVKMVAFIDMLHKATKEVTDLKTGLKPWTMVDVMRLKQLPLYVAMLCQNYENVSKHAHIVWIGTMWVEENIKIVRVGTFEAESGGARHLELTGEQKHLKRCVYKYDIERVREWIVKTAGEIAHDFAMFRDK